MPQPIRVAGAPCEKCQTPYIQGPKGVYCKKCYIDYKNSQKTTEPTYEKAPFVTPQEDQAKWDKIAEGKVRHGFALEAYKAGKELDQALEEEIGNWVSFVVKGKSPMHAQVNPAGVKVEEVPFGN